MKFFLFIFAFNFAFSIFDSYSICLMFGEPIYSVIEKVFCQWCWTFFNMVTELVPWEHGHCINCIILNDEQFPWCNRMDPINVCYLIGSIDWYAVNIFFNQKMYFLNQRICTLCTVKWIFVMRCGEAHWKWKTHICSYDWWIIIIVYVMERYDWGDVCLWTMNFWQHIPFITKYTYVWRATHQTNVPKNNAIVMVHLVFSSSFFFSIESIVFVFCRVHMSLQITNQFEVWICQCISSPVKQCYCLRDILKTCPFYYNCC